MYHSSRFILALFRFSYVVRLAEVRSVLCRFKEAEMRVHAQYNNCSFYSSFLILNFMLGH